METSILKKAGELLLERSRYRQWYRCVAGMAAVVVFVTVYALILPAITLEKETFCGMEEHTHTEDCYENVLICAQEGTGTGAASEEAETSGTSEDSAQSDHPSEEDGSGGQEETEEQSSSDKEEPEAEAHEHSNGCYEKKLICGLEEHMHSEKCYEKQAASEEEKEHVHTEDCYDEDGKLICREEEAEEKTEENPAEEESGKEGGEEEEPAVFCGLEEHVHTDDCYDTDGELVCALEEHEHTEACCSEAIFMLADADEAEWIEVENESELSEAVARVQNGGQISIRVTADFGTGRTYELREPGNEPAADPQNGSERGTEAVLDLNGHTITRTGNGYLFKVSGAKLTVCDQSEGANDPAAVMVGEADAGEEGAASYDKDNKTLTYYFTEYSSDTAELVRKKAVADLNGVGAVEGSGGDGLLYVEKQGILDIAGGRFTNTGGKHALVAEWTGDGREGNTIHISGGCLCGSGSNDKGGGVYFGGGNLTISGGVIAANRAAGQGGGLCAEVNGNVVMTGGVISGNTAAGQGGGLYVKGRFEMTGGEIVGNQAGKDGGGLCAVGGLTVKQSVIAYMNSGRY